MIRRIKLGYRIVDYINNVDRIELIKQANQDGFRLIEDQIYIDGNHLIFTNELHIEPEPARDLEAEIDELKEVIEKLRVK